MPQTYTLKLLILVECKRIPYISYIGIRNHFMTSSYFHRQERAVLSERDFNEMLCICSCLGLSGCFGVFRKMIIHRLFHTA